MYTARWTLARTLKVEARKYLMLNTPYLRYYAPPGVTAHVGAASEKAGVHGMLSPGTAILQICTVTGNWNQSQNSFLKKKTSARFGVGG